MEVKKIYKPGDEVIAGGFRFRYNERGFPVSVGRVAPLAAAATTAAAAPKKKKYKVRRAVDSAIAQRDGEVEAARKADEIIAEARRMGAEVDALIGEMDEILAIQEPVKESAADIVFGIPELSRQIFGFKKAMFQTQMFEGMAEVLREDYGFGRYEDWDDSDPVNFASDVLSDIEETNKVPGSSTTLIVGYNYYGGYDSGAATFADTTADPTSIIVEKEIPIEFKITVKPASIPLRGKSRVKGWINYFERFGYDHVSERIKNDIEEEKERNPEVDEDEYVDTLLPEYMHEFNYTVSWKTKEGRDQALAYFKLLSLSQDDLPKKK